MAIVESSADAAEAMRSLMGLLRLDDDAHAVVVLDMQVRRWTQEARQRIKQERDELRAALDVP